MNTFKKEREQNSLEDKYPWLDQDDERRHVMDKEIFRQVHRFRSVMSE